MNNETDTPEVLSTASTADEAHPATSSSPTPKRRRSTASAKGAGSPGALAEEGSVEPSSGQDVGVSAPKRGRRKSTAVGAPGDPEAMQLSLSVQAQAPEAKPVRARRAKVVPSESSESTGGDLAVNPMPQAESPPVEADRSPSPEAGAPDAAVLDASSEQGLVQNAARGEASVQSVSDEDGGDVNVAAGGLGLPLSPQETLAQASERFADVLGGNFDAEAIEEGVGGEPEKEKRVLRPQGDAPKLQKVLAQAGVSSRRDIEQMVLDGRIAVNGQVAHVGQRVMFGDRIEIDGKPVRVRISPPPARVLAYHKPVGEVVTFYDPEGRPTVFRNLPRLEHGKWQSIGRLDINTEGLLLFSTSGDLANQLMHPRFGVEREYAVRVLGSLDSDKRSQLLQGINIDGYQSSFRTLEDGGGEGANHWYRVTIAEGRYREVRRLFEAVGLTVSRLIRIRYGCVVLPRGLKRGVWAELNEDEVKTIRRMVQSERYPNAPSQRGGRGGAGGPRQSPMGGGGGGRAGGGKQPMGGMRTHGGGGGRPPAPQQQGGNMRPQPPRGPARDDRRYDSDDGDRQPGDPMYIPNPLEQTFDRRFAKGSKRIVSGFGRPSEAPEHDPHPGGKRGGGGKQPDPMQTSIGYIGADAFFRKSGPGGGKRRGGGGSGGGGRGGFGR